MPLPGRSPARTNHAAALPCKIAVTVADLCQGRDFLRLRTMERKLQATMAAAEESIVRRVTSELETRLAILQQDMHAGTVREMALRKELDLAHLDVKASAQEREAIATELCDLRQEVADLRAQLSAKQNPYGCQLAQQEIAHAPWEEEEEEERRVLEKGENGASLFEAASAQLYKLRSSADALSSSAKVVQQQALATYQLIDKLNTEFVSLCMQHGLVAVQKSELFDGATSPCAVTDLTEGKREHDKELVDTDGDENQEGHELKNEAADENREEDEEEDGKAGERDNKADKVEGREHEEELEGEDGDDQDHEEREALEVHQHEDCNVAGEDVDDEEANEGENVREEDKEKCRGAVQQGIPADLYSSSDECSAGEPSMVSTDLVPSASAGPAQPVVGSELRSPRLLADAHQEVKAMIESVREEHDDRLLVLELVLLSTTSSKVEKKGGSGRAVPPSSYENIMSAVLELQSQFEGICGKHDARLAVLENHVFATTTRAVPPAAPTVIEAPPGDDLAEQIKKAILDLESALDQLRVAHMARIYALEVEVFQTNPSKFTPFGGTSAELASSGGSTPPRLLAEGVMAENSVLVDVSPEPRTQPWLIDSAPSTPTTDSGQSLASTASPSSSVFAEQSNCSGDRSSRSRSPTQEKDPRGHGRSPRGFESPTKSSMSKQKPRTRSAHAAARAPSPPQAWR